MISLMERSGDYKGARGAVAPPPLESKNRQNYHPAIFSICFFAILQKISSINTSIIRGLVSNSTPFHRKQSRIDMEDRSNLLLENPAFNAKCLNLSSILESFLLKSFQKQ